MSIKGKVLHTTLTSPMVSSDFTVVIPGIIDSPIRCNSTSLPSDILNEVSLVVGGQEIFLPAKVHPSGEWTCSLYESEIADVSYQLDLMKASQIGMDNLIPAEYHLFDVYIYVHRNGVPVYGKVLRRAWVKSVAPIKLDASAAGTPVSVDVTFRYQKCDRIL